MLLYCLSKDQNYNLMKGKCSWTACALDKSKKIKRSYLRYKKVFRVHFKFTWFDQNLFLARSLNSNVWRDLLHGSRGDEVCCCDLNTSVCVRLTFDVDLAVFAEQHVDLQQGLSDRLIYPRTCTIQPERYYTLTRLNTSLNFTHCVINFLWWPQQRFSDPFSFLYFCFGQAC